MTAEERLAPGLAMLRLEPEQAREKETDTETWGAVYDPDLAADRAVFERAGRMSIRHDARDRGMGAGDQQLERTHTLLDRSAQRSRIRNRNVEPEPFRTHPCNHAPRVDLSTDERWRACVVALEKERVGAVR